MTSVLSFLAILAVSAHVAELHVTPHMLPGGTVATFRVASGN